jgi:phosphoenolpyruvate-protein kinase (PTS system EI component)
MDIKKGIAVSPGVVISTALVLDAEDLVIPRRQIDASGVEPELARLNQAIVESSADLQTAWGISGIVLQISAGLARCSVMNRASRLSRG